MAARALCVALTLSRGRLPVYTQRFRVTKRAVGGAHASFSATPLVITAVHPPGGMNRDLAAAPCPPGTLSGFTYRAAADPVADVGGTAGLHALRRERRPRR